MKLIFTWLPSLLFFEEVGKWSPVLLSPPAPSARLKRNQEESYKITAHSLSGWQ